MTARGAQLALRFPLSSRTRFDSFVVGANAELVRRLEQLSETPGFGGCFLYGALGVGRTHLLQAVCHHHGTLAGSGAAIYLPLAEPDVGPGSLEGLESLSLVALDDADCWLGRADAERALLALYQGLQSAGGRLLVSAGASATRLAFHFADLASRFRGLPGYQVQPLADADKAQVLRRLAEERGLALTAPVLEFWLARSSRDLASLVDQLERLDEAAMAAQRRITVPLLKEVLGL
jgi:DnaA family protein